jgi:hypothetical protein
VFEFWSEGIQEIWKEAETAVRRKIADHDGKGR